MGMERAGCREPGCRASIPGQRGWAIALTALPALHNGHLSPSHAQPAECEAEWMRCPAGLAAGQDSQGQPRAHSPRDGNAPRQPLCRAFPSVPE